MTSWHWRAFCSAGTLWGESTDHRLISMMKDYCCGALMCHWWSSLWVKVKTHNCIDGANDVPWYFYLNWDIFFKWNAFKITVMSCSICPGFNVLWWHHAGDTHSTVWFNDWRVVVNSVTDLLIPSRAAYHEILSILPISSAINAPTL